PRASPPRARRRPSTAWSCACRRSSPGAPADASRAAAGAATGRGVARTSPGTAARCPAAWCRHRTGSVSATPWPTACTPPSTTPPTASSGRGSTRTTRPRSAARARSMPAPSEPRATDGLVARALDEAAAALEALRRDAGALRAIEAAGALLAGALAAGRRVYACGNGGSLCDAMHFAEELSGRFRGDRPPLPAAAVADAAPLPCTANDHGYEEGFARWIEAHGATGDVLLAISTSGASPNVLRAAERARARGLRVIALTGRRDAPLAAHADLAICTPAGRWSDRVQELHIKVVHVLVELVERRLFPETAGQGTAAQSGSTASPSRPLRSRGPRSRDLPRRSCSGRTEK